LVEIFFVKIKYVVGVQMKETYEVKQLDEDFFEGE